MADAVNDPNDRGASEAAADSAADFELLPSGDVSLLGDEILDLGDALNAVLDKGAVIHGNVTIAVADIDLIRLSLGLLLHGVETAEGRGARASGGGSAPAPGAGPSGAPSGSLAGSLGSIMPDPSRGGASAASSVPHTPSSATASAPRAPLSGPVQEASPSAPGGTSLNSVAQGLPERINADVQGVESGLARLVLTLIEVLRKVLEHQAVRRMEGGRLSAEEVERLGLALSRLHDRMGDLKRVFGLTDEDLQIDLGPLGRLR
jgi:hypothetical protein